MRAKLEAVLACRGGEPGPGYDAGCLSDMTAREAGPGDVSLVQQQFGEEVDINTIVRRFGLTQEMPSGIAGGVYGDFSGITDYESAVEAIDRARSGFMKLPAEVRDRFGNDPARLIRLAHELPEAEFVRAFEGTPMGGVEPPEEAAT